MRNNLLELALYEYIKSHEDENIDIHSIRIAFPKYRLDTLKATLGYMRVNKLIYKVNLSGEYYKYVVNKTIKL